MKEAQKVQKLRALFHYFNTVTNDRQHEPAGTEPNTSDTHKPMNQTMDFNSLQQLRNLMDRLPLKGFA